MTKSLLFDVPFDGMFWGYVLFVAPAGLVGLLKGRLAMFFVGFVTFGLAWFVGAFGRAADDSWWAGRFYADNPEAGTRASDDLRKHRQKVVLVTTLAVLLVIGVVTARPAPILGVDGQALQYDVGGIISFEEKCEGPVDGKWTCFTYDDAVSGDVPFEVKVGPLGCWTAKRTDRAGSAGSRIDSEMSGCLSMFSYVRLFDYIL